MKTELIRFFESLEDEEDPSGDVSEFPSPNFGIYNVLYRDRSGVHRRILVKARDADEAKEYVETKKNLLIGDIIEVTKTLISDLESVKD
jgi:hypothetical protein